MTKKFLPFEIARFKREAKVRSKTTSSTYSQSLDEIADREGWDNWSLLSKHRDKDSPTPFYMFARTQAQQKESLRAGKGNDKKYSGVDDIASKFVSARNAVDFAVHYIQALLKQSRYWIPISSVAYFEMRTWLPYRIHETAHPGIRLLVNRQYTPVGMPRVNSREHVEYENFHNLQIRLGDNEIQKCCDPNHVRTGGIFDDGSTPWRSRENATVYLSRLLILRDILQR